MYIITSYHQESAVILPGLCCGLRDEALQKALLTQGRKNSQELYEEDVESAGWVESSRCRKVFPNCAVL